MEESLKELDKTISILENLIGNLDSVVKCNPEGEMGIPKPPECTIREFIIGFEYRVSECNRKLFTTLEQLHQELGENKIL